MARFLLGWLSIILSVFGFILLANWLPRDTNRWGPPENIQYSFPPDWLGFTLLGITVLLLVGGILLLRRKDES